MQLATLKSLFDAAISHQTDIQLIFPHGDNFIYPLAATELPTGELQITASDAHVFRNQPHREPRSAPPSLPHTHTWVIVPESVQAAVVREPPSRT